MPVFSLWMARFLAREVALFGGVLALLVLVLLTSRGGRLFAAGLGVLLLLPLLWPLPTLWRAGVSFSLGQYVGLGRGPGLDIKLERDVVLDRGVGDGSPVLSADLYHGSGKAPHPFVLVIHGGSWIHGDKGDAPHISRQLAAAGITAVDLRYRLSPRYPFPAAVEDVKCALGRLRENSAKLGLDPHRAALLGRSAGGQLALLAAYSVGDPTLPPACAVPDEPVAAVVALYPLTELRHAYEYPPLPDPEETRSVLEAHFGGPPASLPAAYHQASPSSHIVPKAERALPPTLFLHGKSDMLVPLWHSEQLYERLRAAGQAATLYAIPLAEHAFDFHAGGVGEQLEGAVVPRFLLSAFSAGH